MSIQVQNVSKTFEDFHALRDVNVEIQPGQLNAVLGPDQLTEENLISHATNTHH